MAGEVQLKLGISLDLGYFRTEMQKAVNIVNSEFTGRLKVKFNREVLNNELRNLDRAIKRKTYRIKIGGNIDSLPNKIDSLKRRLESMEGMKIGLSIDSKIGSQEVTAFRNAVKQKLSGIVIDVGVKAGAVKGAEQAAAKSPGFSAAREGIKTLGVEQLRARAFKSFGQESRTAQQVSEYLDRIVNENLKGSAKSKALNEVRDYLAEELARAARRDITASFSGADPSRRGAFPYIAKTGPIDAQALIAESLKIAEQIDREIADKYRAIQKQAEGLRLAASRMLPPAMAVGVETGAREAVVNDFYRRMNDAANVFARNFSANSYLPQATRKLADAMMGSTRALPSARGAIGALPSREMMDQARFQRAIQAAVRADIDNALRVQMQGRMLPAAGQTSYLSPQQREQQKFQVAMAKAAEIDARYAARALIKELRAEMSKGLLPATGQTGGAATSARILAGQRFAAPSLQGRRAGDISGIMSNAGPIADKLRASAIEFAKNAPAVIKYLNLFSTAGGIDISDLPGPNESPGQYIRRIQQSLQRSLKEGRFGPGTLPTGLPRSYFQPGQGPQLPGMPLQLALPAAGQTTAAGGPNYPYDRVRGTGGGGGGGRGGALAARYPSTELPRAYLTGMQLSGALKGMEGLLSKAKLPLTGAIHDLGAEFGFTLQQIILFGTAYKALAFITNLPNQAISAAASLQTFKNSLNAVTSQSGQFEQSMQFIDKQIKQLNVPIDSARQGFTRLFASLEPAGIDAKSIQGLFEGITKASATFGLSGDQVDRVFNAFSQMASKGQVMAEELKGQLGDVLPGSMALFAEAAKMTMPEFTKAMEQGRFSGDAMRVLLENVSVLMNTKFSGAASKAAETIQGKLNLMQNSLQYFYEGLEPIVNSILNSLMPAFKTFSADALSAIQALAGGSANAFGNLTPEAQSLYKIFGQIGQVLKNLGSGIITFGQTISGLTPVIRTIAQLLSNLFAIPVVARIAAYTAAIAGLIAAFQFLASTGILSAIAAMVKWVVLLDVAKIRSYAAGLATVVQMLFSLVTAARAAEVAFIALKVAGAGIIAGGLLLLFDAVITKLLGIGKAAQDAAQRTRQLANELEVAASMGDVPTITAKVSEAEQKVTSLTIARKALQSLEAKGMGFQGKLSEQEIRALSSTGGLTGLTVNAKTGFVAGFKGQIKANIEALTKGLNAAAGEAGMISENLGDALDKAESIRRTQASLQTLPPGDTKEQGAKKSSLESYYSLQDQLARNSADFAASQSEEEFRYKVSLLEKYYDVQEARANKYQKEALQFEREMMMIEARRREALFKAALDVQRATGSVTGGVNSTGIFSSQQITAATQDASKFTGIANMCAEAVKSFYKSLGMSLPGVTAWADSVRNAGQVMTDWSKIKPGDIVATGRPGDTPHAGVYTGGQNVFHQSRSRGLKTGNFPDLSYFQQGGYFVRPTKAMPAPVSGDQKRDAVAQQKVMQAVLAQTAITRRADALAAEEQVVAFEKYKAVAFPIAEQELTNKLLAKRNELFRSGATEEQVDKEMQLYENQLRGSYGIAVINRLLKEGIITKEKATQYTNELNDAIARQNLLLGENAALQRQTKFDNAMAALKDRLAMAGALTPDQELRQRIKQQGFAGQEADTLFKAEKMALAAEKLKSDLQGIASAIGDAFGNAFKGVISGTTSVREALASLFQSIADSFADMVSQMIASWLRTQVIKGLQTILSPFVNSIGIGDAFSTTSAFSMAPGTIPGASGIQMPVFGSANGNVLIGGFQAFANGGVVQGPTLGLIGEGMYNEAVVPLPDGRSIPVDLRGGGDSGSPTVIVNVDAKGTEVQGNDNQAKALGGAISAAVQAEIVKQQRPGGLLARTR